MMGETPASQDYSMERKQEVTWPIILTPGAPQYLQYPTTRTYKSTTDELYPPRSTVGRRSGQHYVQPVDHGFGGLDFLRESQVLLDLFELGQSVEYGNVLNFCKGRRAHQAARTLFDVSLRGVGTFRSKPACCWQ